MAKGRPRSARHRTPLDRALAAKQEARTVDFKESFDPDSSRDWCEIVKDIAAMSNSGGGVILFGVRDDGTAARWNPDPVLRLDPADVTNKIAKYTGEEFGDFTISEARRGRKRVAALVIESSDVPLVFTKPGQYTPVGEKRQKTVFAKGTMYFRHGTKSEPANVRDLTKFLDRRVEAARRFWFDSIRKVGRADPGSSVAIVEPGDRRTATPVRLVTDVSAPGVAPVNYDETHPHRQKEVVRHVAQALAPRRVTTFDIQAVRAAHGVQARAEFAYEPKHSSAQYSDAFVAWIIEQAHADPEFFERARDVYRSQRAVRKARRKDGKSP